MRTVATILAACVALVAADDHCGEPAEGMFLLPEDSRLNPTGSSIVVDTACMGGAPFYDNCDTDETGDGNDGRPLIIEGGVKYWLRDWAGVGAVEVRPQDCDDHDGGDDDEWDCPEGKIPSAMKIAGAEQDPSGMIPYAFPWGGCVPEHICGQAGTYVDTMPGVGEICVSPYQPDVATMMGFEETNTVCPPGTPLLVVTGVVPRIEDDEDAFGIAQYCTSDGDACRGDGGTIVVISEDEYCFEYTEFDWGHGSGSGSGSGDYPDYGSGSGSDDGDDWECDEGKIPAAVKIAEFDTDLTGMIPYALPWGGCVPREWCGEAGTTIESPLPNGNAGEMCTSPYSVTLAAIIAYEETKTICPPGAPLVVLTGALPTAAEDDGFGIVLGCTMDATTCMQNEGGFTSSHEGLDFCFVMPAGNDGSGSGSGSGTLDSPSGSGSGSSSGSGDYPDYGNYPDYGSGSGSDDGDDWECPEGKIPSAVKIAEAALDLTGTIPYAVAWGGCVPVGWCGEEGTTIETMPGVGEICASPYHVGIPEVMAYEETNTLCPPGAPLMVLTGALPTAADADDGFGIVLGCTMDATTCMQNEGGFTTSHDDVDFCFVMPAGNDGSGSGSGSGTLDSPSGSGSGSSSGSGDYPDYGSGSGSGSSLDGGDECPEGTLQILVTVERAEDAGMPPFLAIGGCIPTDICAALGFINEEGDGCIAPAMTNADIVAGAMEAGEENLCYGEDSSLMTMAAPLTPDQDWFLFVGCRRQNDCPEVVEEDGLRFCALEMPADWWVQGEPGTQGGMPAECPTCDDGIAYVGRFTGACMGCASQEYCAESVWGAIAPILQSPPPLMVVNGQCLVADGGSSDDNLDQVSDECNDGFTRSMFRVDGATTDGACLESGDSTCSGLVMIPQLAYEDGVCVMNVPAPGDEYPPFPTLRA